MKIFANHFDDLDFMDCTYAGITVGRDLTRIEVVGGLLIEPGHPAFASKGANAASAVLVFRGVSRWHKVSHPYLKTLNEAEFGDQVTEVFEWPPNPAAPAGQQYSIEGIHNGKPASWVDIDITAEGFELHLHE
ncbi:hypothetical protein WJU23_14460 [Prosthecobacter sp. SYSU 5D2]|uniref:hypothetical protein n=1 Tax=Prosthecobacter sp. SYSU 5D2 TaxID=3134134 RepID=UPI0031FED631